MRPSWIFLVVAGLFEVGWPVGLKLAQTPGRGLVGSLVAIVCMAASGLLLYLAQRDIPMGTAYAVWTGIGAAGAFVVGLALYGDPANLPRILGVGLIVAGVVTLKLSH
ncbi:DMT family transporter [Desulfovibrio sp. TomC]|uniref:DMT family transporter n=1 Tax=Desulfovibrio sp. TomC TaxID=1562888 RepID=UPI000575B314|nr:multidrug efflux SMR transporter [Desulfovibrio sp. TomC]KHK03081.1 Quaternary ammonium compound-resistance protein SugE [Desulfovibrio sp. TomC]